jgi:uncharacterized protein (DUF433 family)
MLTKMQEIEQLLASLTLQDRAQVLGNALRQWGDVHPGITSTPGVCGGDPCIVRTRIPVWLLESLRRQGATDAELLEAYPHLHAQDLVNAWAYVGAHRGEIDRQIAEQEAA